MNKLVRAVYRDLNGRELTANLSHLDNGFGRPSCKEGFREGLAIKYLSQVGHPTCVNCQNRAKRKAKLGAAAA